MGQFSVTILFDAGSVLSDIQQVYDHISADFEAYNAERAKDSLPPVRPPSKETVRRHIRALDPYEVLLNREGEDAARKKFMPVARGIDVTFPLERVEIDEHTIDIIAFMESAGLAQFLTKADLHRLGLDKSKARWTITVAICARTRCILGLVFSRSASSKSSLKVLEMILKDKGQWADAAGGLGPWDMHGLPMLIVTDNGAAFVSQDFRMVCEDLGITTARAPAGFPEMRGTIERFFHTLNLGLAGRLPGRTFSDIKQKGDANPEADAAMTFDDLVFCLTRWIVDVYHNQPHGSLGGETPLECWRRLTGEYGVTPPPDAQTKREVFGQRLSRTLTKQGVRVMGLNYHSEAIADLLLHRKSHEVEVSWHPDNIGAVSVHINGKTISVPCTEPGFDGVSASHWSAAVRAIKASDTKSKTVSREIVMAALKAIEDRSGTAMRTAGLLVDAWDAERVKHMENRLFIGFSIGERPKPTKQDGSIGRSIPDDDWENEEASLDNSGEQIRRSVTSTDMTPATESKPNMPTNWSIEE